MLRECKQTNTCCQEVVEWQRHLHIHTHTRTHTHICVCLCACACACVRVCAYVCVCVNVYKRQFSTEFSTYIWYYVLMQDTFTKHFRLSVQIFIRILYLCSVITVQARIIQMVINMNYILWNNHKTYYCSFDAFSTYFSIDYIISRCTCKTLWLEGEQCWERKPYPNFRNSEFW